jgi:curved DNA-binding protein CbpA
MNDDEACDYYEALQISPNAEPDTVHRVYRLLAQRFHPDNRESGDADRFRLITEAYAVLSDPEKRAQYDVRHQRQRQDRYRLVAASTRPENDFEDEQIVRLTVLEVLYTKRRLEPQDPGLFDMDLERLIGRPREHLEFTFWYLISRHLVKRGDHSRLYITAEGVDYLEQNYDGRLKRRRLEAGDPT